jgi:hypothetical protein
MPGITLDLSDAAELAETLTLLTQWLRRTGAGHVIIALYARRAWVIY